MKSKKQIEMAQGFYNPNLRDFAVENAEREIRQYRESRRIHMKSWLTIVYTILGIMVPLDSFLAYASTQNPQNWSMFFGTVSAGLGVILLLYFVLVPRDPGRL